MTSNSVVTLLLFGLLVGLVVWLCRRESIRGGGLTGGILAAAAAAVIVGRFDQIANITLQLGDNRVAIEAKQARDEAVATAAEVRRLATGMAGFSIMSLLNENRFVALADEERMLRRRDELEKFLRGAGVDDATIRTMLQQVTRLVDWDFRVAILSDAIAAWHPTREAPTDYRRLKLFEAQLRTALQQGDRSGGLAEAEKTIREYHVQSEGLSSSIAAYRKMLESGRLPKTGSIDDLHQAPIGQ